MHVRLNSPLMKGIARQYIGIRGGHRTLQVVEEKEALVTVLLESAHNTPGMFKAAIAAKDMKEKLERSMQTAISVLRRHKEYDRYKEPEKDYQEYGNKVHIAYELQFAKYGKEIFRVRPEDDDGDYDWPELVGGRYLEKVLVDALKSNGLKPRKGVIEVEIMPHEKGHITLGYAMRKPKGKLYKAIPTSAKLLGKDAVALAQAMGFDVSDRQLDSIAKTFGMARHEAGSVFLGNAYIWDKEINKPLAKKIRLAWNRWVKSQKI